MPPQPSASPPPTPIVKGVRRLLKRSRKDAQSHGCAAARDSAFGQTRKSAMRRSVAEAGVIPGVSKWRSRFLNRSSSALCNLEVFHRSLRIVLRLRMAANGSQIGLAGCKSKILRRCPCSAAVLPHAAFLSESHCINQKILLVSHRRTL